MVQRAHDSVCRVTGAHERDDWWAPRYC